MAPYYDQDGMQMLVTSGYTPPDLILNLLVNPNHITYQELHDYDTGGNPLWASPWVNDELYAASPSYTVAAGGHYNLPWATIAGFSNSDDIGKALPTTIIPTGLFLNRDAMIRFEGLSDDKQRYNLCVAPNFACGIGVAGYAGSTPGFNLPQAGNCIVNNGPWLFLNYSGSCRPGPGPYGFYAAQYRVREGAGWGDDTRGFVELFDTYVNSSVSFDTFISHAPKQQHPDLYFRG
jgi:hypothetical protein